MNRHGPDIERLRRSIRHRPDRAFRHNAPGFCCICEIWIESALDVHMTNAQLWRCPVEWCAVWNVAKFFPTWTISGYVWQTALRPDVSGVAVDARLFHEAGCRLVQRYLVYKDPFPHPTLREGVIPRLLSCVCRVKVIVRFIYLRISIPASGAPPGHVPADCFLWGVLLEGTGQVIFECRLLMTFPC